MYVVLDPDVIKGFLKNKRPGRMSASRYKTFKRCPRKFMHDRDQTPPDPRRPTNKRSGTVFGGLVHSELEDLVNGQIPLIPRDPEIVELAKSMRETSVFAQPRTEVKYALIIDNDLWFYGFIDILDLGSITDWKTSIDPDLYAIKKREIPSDVQAVIYGTVAIWLQDLTEILVRFVYGSSKTLLAGPIREKMLSSTTVARELEEIIEGSRYALTGGGAAYYPQNFEACGDFGGCPYRSQCKRSLLDIALEECS